MPADRDSAPEAIPTSRGSGTSLREPTGRVYRLERVRTGRSGLGHRGLMNGTGKPQTRSGLLVTGREGTGGVEQNVSRSWVDSKETRLQQPGGGAGMGLQ